MKETKNILVCDYCARLIEDPEYSLTKEYFTDEMAHQFRRRVTGKKARLAKSGWHLTGEIEWAGRRWLYSERCEICGDAEGGNRWWAIAERNIYSQ